MSILFAITTFGLGPIAGTVAQAAITFGLAFGALELGLAAGKGKGIMGGALSGSLNGLKKFRSNRASHNIHGLKTGERFSGSRFIPGSTRAAEFANKAGFSVSNGAMPFTGKTRAALGHAQTSEAKKMLDTFKEKDIDQHDDTLRYGTYLNDRQGWRAVRDFHMQNGVNQETAEARANAAQSDWRATGIKKTAATATASAMQMGRTGTAYRDMRDQVETIARAGGGNDTATADLAGDLNATSKEKRPDLTPGNGELTQMALAVSQRGRGAVSQGTYDQQTAHAWANSGDLGSLARSMKGQGVTSLSSAHQTNARMLQAWHDYNTGGPGRGAAEATLRGHYGMDIDPARNPQAAGLESRERGIGATIAHTAHGLAGTNYSFGSEDNLNRLIDIDIARNGTPMDATTGAPMLPAAYRNMLRDRRYAQLPPP